MRKCGLGMSPSGVKARLQRANARAAMKMGSAATSSSLAPSQRATTNDKGLVATCERKRMKTLRATTDPELIVAECSQ